MDTAKIRLSSEEAALITRADLILTKNNILQKVKQLLSSLLAEQQILLDRVANFEEFSNSSPKISKGENYKGLPWMVLDYPRCFNKESFFAVRTLFWWGNFFSATLHLSGKYKLDYEKKIRRSFEYLKQKDFSVCINEDQWEHHFEANNYQPLSELPEMKFEEIISKKSFIKLAKKIPLEHWNDAEIKLPEIFSQLIYILKD